MLEVDAFNVILIKLDVIKNVCMLQFKDFAAVSFLWSP